MICLLDFADRVSAKKQVGQVFVNTTTFLAFGSNMNKVTFHKHT